MALRPFGQLRLVGGGMPSWLQIARTVPVLMSR